MATAKEELARARARGARLLQERKKQVRMGITLAEFAGGAMGAGYLTGRYPDKDFFGLDADLAVGGGLALAGLLELGGDYSEDLMAVGAGLLAGPAYRRGESAGKKARAKK